MRGTLLSKRLFRLKTDDTILINWLKSKPEFQKFAIEIFNKVRTGELVPKLDAQSNKDLDQKHKELRNKNLDLKNQILQRQLSYHNNFDSEPTEGAKKAIKNGVEQRELTDSEFESVKKYITVRRDTYNSNKWIGKCDLCKEGESYDNYRELLDDMVRHLTADHSKKVMVMPK